nr:unnamed protein product [Callosobruchus chinensis]
MNDRAKRIVRLALEKPRYYDSDESLSHPFSDNFLDDPVFIPLGSSDSDETNSDDNVLVPSKPTPYNKRLDEPSSSSLFTCKRLGHDSEYLIEEAPDAKQLTVVEMQQVDNNSTPEIQQGIVQLSLRDLSASVWGPSEGNHLQFDEAYEAGIKPMSQAALQGHKPVDYYMWFIDTDILDLIADQANHYATQFLIEKENVSNNSRVQKWEPTSRKEIAHFLGLLDYMGIVRMNSLRDYWSTKWLFKNDVT